MPAPTPLAAVWLRRAAIPAVLALAIERLWALLHAPPTDFDDAYMFLRYAHNLAAGFGLRWNRDAAPVYGATSLPQVVVVAFVRWLCPRCDDATVLQTTSRASAILLLLALIFTCARFARHPFLHRRPWLWAALLLPLLAYAEPFRFHAQTGMDTMLAALANTALLFTSLALAEQPTPLRAVAAAVVGYLAFLVRPDAAMYAFGVPTLCLALGAPAPPSTRRRALIIFLATLGPLVAADLALKQHLLGTPWPLGAYVKRPWYYGRFAGEFTWNPFWFLRVFLGGLWPFLLALIVCASRRSARIGIALLVPVAITFAALFRVNQIMGHLGRFFFPALPFVVVAAALAVDSRLSGRLAEAPPRVSPRALAAAGLLLIAGAQALTVAGTRYEARAATQSLASVEGGYTVPAALPLPFIDSWTSSQQMAGLARAAPAGTRFAMSEHGLVGAAAPDAVIIDVLGLHDREFARGGFRVDELWRRRPDVIWMPHPDHTQMVRDILDSDELWARYDFYPDAFSYGVALRRDGPHAAALAALLDAHWEATYSGYALDAYRADRAARR